MQLLELKLKNSEDEFKSRNKLIKKLFRNSNSNNISDRGSVIFSDRDSLPLIGKSDTSINSDFSILNYNSDYSQSN